jgi:peptide chain release factor subunit 1
LAEVRSEPKGVLSVYCDLDPSLFPTPAQRRTEVDSLVTEAGRRFERGELNHEERLSRRAAVERLRDTLSARNYAEGGTRSIAVFAAPAKDVFEMLRLGEALAPAVVVDDTPYLRPLAGEAGPRTWVVLLADRRNARILYGGEIRLVELASFVADVPPHHKQGGWSQARFQRHSDEAARRHLRDAAAALSDLFANTPFDALAVAAPDAVWGEIVEELHPPLRERLRGRVHVEVGFSTTHEVLEQARPIFEAAREQDLNEILDTIEEAARDRVALGLSSVLEALNERSVGTLVVSGWFAASGVRCPRCSWLAVSADRCPYDGAPVEERPDVVDDAVDLALAQNARVVTVESDAPRRPPEPMVALLRIRGAPFVPTDILTRQGVLHE